jgi:predicted nucleic acid-binding protein
MPFVLDASIAAAWVFPDEDAAVATEAAFQLVDDHALVPTLFWFEIRNLLLVGERRGRVDQPAGMRFLAHLDSLPLEDDRLPASAALLALARSHGLSAYDAAYLELAQRRAVPLATLDRRLAAAAEAEGVGLMGPS